MYLRAKRCYTRANMDSFLLSLKKRVILPTVFIGFFLLWLYLCYGHWDSYWNGTIYRVQTTDFNLLHHTVPQTLSQLIVAGRDDLVQDVLDSSYGLFGMAVTDPSGQSILYQTNKVYARGSWQEKLTPEALLAEAKKEPPDLLTDPPPVEPLWEHATPRDPGAPHRSPFQFNKNRKVLGYVYYIRANPPTFREDILTFLGPKFWEMSGAKRGYFYITLACLAFGSAIILLIWLRQRVVETKQLELKHIQRELDIRKKALEHLTGELATQKTRKAWLEKEAEDSYRRAQSLKQALVRLRDSLTIVNAAQGAGVNGSDDAIVRMQNRNTPPSSVLEEIEELIPALAGNADALKSQATLLHDYCTVLEQRQAEMKRIVEYAYDRSQAVTNLIDMTPH